MDARPKSAYSEGSVWSLQFCRVKPGQTRDYLNHLGKAWKPLMEEACRREIILSYRVLVSDLTRPDDWDIMMVVELKNMAALDGFREKMDALIGAAAGGGGCNLFLEPGTECIRLLRQINLG